MKLRTILLLMAFGLAASCTDNPAGPETPTEPADQAAPGFTSTPMAHFNVVGDPGDGPTVTTDKLDYQPGDTVTISGSGWLAGETVQLVLEEDPATHDALVFTSVVDGNGDFVNRDFVVQDHDLGVTFTLSATGLTSGLTAAGTFTDGSLTSGSIEVRNSTCTTATTSFASGATACAQMSLSITGGGSTNIWVQWISPSTVRSTVQISVPAGNTTAQDTKVVTEIGTWSVVLCGSNPGSSACAGPQLKDTKTFSVTSSNVAPIVNAGGPYSGNEGSPISLSGATATDGDNDALLFTWTANTTGIDSGGTCTFSDASLLNPTVTCTDDSQGAPGGKFTLTLSVDDQHGHVVTSNADLTVSNVAPDITAIVLNLPAGGNIYPITMQPTVNATSTDAGSNDIPVLTCIFQLFNMGSQVGSDRTCGAGLGAPEAGVYDVRVTVADDDGGSDTESVQVVVYDPSAGFVTGGGWIDSPAGAYRPDLGLSGKATFGFVSKYKKGATRPDGNTEFQFHAGGMNFHSENYDWLVVNQLGTNAQFKGRGTINGTGDYWFMLWANDGSPDTFRIRIWYEDGGEVVVYDNGFNQPIGSGSIVIQTGGNGKNK